MRVCVCVCLAYYSFGTFYGRIQKTSAFDRAYLKRCSNNCYFSLISNMFVPHFKMRLLSLLLLLLLESPKWFIKITKSVNVNRLVEFVCAWVLLLYYSVGGWMGGWLRVTILLLRWKGKKKSMLQRMEKWIHRPFFRKDTLQQTIAY